MDKLYAVFSKAFKKKGFWQACSNVTMFVNKIHVLHIIMYLKSNFLVYVFFFFFNHYTTTKERSDSINNTFLFSRLQGIFNSWTSSINSFMPDREAVREDKSVSVTRRLIIRPHARTHARTHARSHTHTHTHTHTDTQRRTPLNAQLLTSAISLLASSVVWHDNRGKKRGFSKSYKSKLCKRQNCVQLQQQRH